MMHSRRMFSVSVVESAEELAHKLTVHNWTLCTGFCVRGHEEYLFLNDATNEDGAGEFGVIKGGIDAASRQQLESITFSWCSYDKALEYIQQSLAGQYDKTEFVRPAKLRVEPAADHDRCPLCAWGGNMDVTLNAAEPDFADAYRAHRLAWPETLRFCHALGLSPTYGY